MKLLRESQKPTVAPSSVAISTSNHSNLKIQIDNSNGDRDRKNEKLGPPQQMSKAKSGNANLVSVNTIVEK